MGNYLAFDFGAESGRALLGSLSGGKLVVEELHRFPNTPVRVLGALYWDTLRLWHEIGHGIGVAARERKIELAGIGIDTWGVDYGLLGADGMLIDNPRHYRDARTNGMMEKLFETVPRDQVFGYTGIQFMQLKYAVPVVRTKAGGIAGVGGCAPAAQHPGPVQLLAHGRGQIGNHHRQHYTVLRPAHHELVRGNAAALGPAGRDPGRAGSAGDSAGQDAGTALHAGVRHRRHDTAAAVAAVPAAGGKNWCYVSSGTWSLMGLELDAPVIDAESLALNFTNEVGVAAKIRLLKNIAGLWLLQECRRAWMEEGAEYSYEQLAGWRRPPNRSPRPSTRMRFWSRARCRARSQSIAARPARSRRKPTVGSRAPFWRAWRCGTAT